MQDITVQAFCCGHDDLGPSCTCRLKGCDDVVGTWISVQSLSLPWPKRSSAYHNSKRLAFMADSPRTCKVQQSKSSTCWMHQAQEQWLTDKEELAVQTFAQASRHVTGEVHRSWRSLEYKLSIHVNLSTDISQGWIEPHLEG